MSDSRLEKFIYAICSMDVSDLPVPLSRIEKLWNCLITGETPDFEPLSRNEKYLMAMLDRYDISNLPAPTSRGEKLLYKIAVGETDLSDVPGYLSRYEELLKYLIENGGISDFEYILQTLNQRLSTLYSTKERPVKSAILKGSTKYRDIDTGEFLETFEEGRNLELVSVKMPVLTTTGKNFAPNTPISKSNTENGVTFSSDGNTISMEGINTGYVGYDLATQTASSSLLAYTTHPNTIKFYADKKIANAGTYTLSGIFETYQSQVIQNGYVISVSVIYDDNKKIDITPNATTDGEKMLQKTFAVEKHINGIFVGLWYNGFDSTQLSIRNIQLEKSSIKTNYEPYQSNILTVNEEVELGSVCDVQDELNVVTGEVVKATTKIKLDSTLGWVVSNDYGNGKIAFISSNEIYGKNQINGIVSDRFPTNGDSDSISLSGVSGRVIITELTSKISNWNDSDTNGEKVRKFGIYLDSLNAYARYINSEKVVKTVDLTTVDQDGQPTKLKTFNDITHVEIKADNVIPSVDVEVATKINEALSTMGPQQLDISETQNKLGQTIDEQSENTDATMMATTEIYEQTL